MPVARRLAAACTVAALAGALVGAAPPVTAAVAVHEVYPVPANGVFTLAGHGYGHGHGMSQFGAYGAALKGLTDKQIVAFYYPHTTLAVEPARKVRVLLHAGQGGPLVMHPRAGVATTASTPGVADCTLPTSLDGGKTTITRWRARGVSTTPGDRLRLQATSDNTHWAAPALPTCADGWSHPVDGSITFANGGLMKLVRPSGALVTYRGALRAAFTGTSIYPVNVVPLESYLRAVVPSEMPSSWSAPALQAQAVAARTYASYVVAHPHPGLSAYFDLYDDTRDQMYTGVSSEVASTDAAISVTSGQVLHDGGGHPVFAQFSS